MKTKNPVLKRVRFYYEALCHVDADAENMDIADVIRECGDGEMSGLLLGSPEVKLLDLNQAKRAVAEHCTERFELPEYRNGKRVWWTDPDAGISSGWYTIKNYTGEFYELVNRAGGECEAPEHELSLTEPIMRKS